MARASRRVHIIEIKPGGPVKSVIGNTDINHRTLVVGQFFQSRDDADTIHEYQITSVEPKRAKWVREVGPAPPVMQHPWSAS